MEMTDEERGRAMYEKEAKNWPSPIGWNGMAKGVQQLWIERAKRKARPPADSNI